MFFYLPGLSSWSGWSGWSGLFDLSDLSSSTLFLFLIISRVNIRACLSFASFTVNFKLKSSSNTDVIAIIIQNVYGFPKVGRLDSNYDSSNLWYQQSSNLSLDNVFNGSNSTNYGSLVYKNSNEWGPILNTSLGDDEIYIFIGFKNSVNLIN